MFMCLQPGVHCGGFRPVVDGGFIPDWPENIRQRGEHQIVPEVIGITRNDDFISLMGRMYTDIVESMIGTSTHVVLMLGYCRRRLANINPTAGERLLFAENEWGLMPPLCIYNIFYSLLNLNI